MKTVYAVVFGLGAFFAMNCGSSASDGYGNGGPSGSGSGNQASSATQDPASSTSSTEGSVTVVKVSGHSFEPAEVRVKAGTTVRWEWVSGSHNVVSGPGCSPDGNFSSGTKLQGAGTKFEETFDKAGSFPYYCDPHCGMGMKGKVIVE